MRSDPVAIYQAELVRPGGSKLMVSTSSDWPLARAGMYIFEGPKIGAPGSGGVSEKDENFIIDFG